LKKEESITGKRRTYKREKIGKCKIISRKKVEQKSIIWDRRREGI